MKQKYFYFGFLLLLPVLIYYADYITDDEHRDCFNNKINHILIFFGTIILLLIAGICFVLFYRSKND